MGVLLIALLLPWTREPASGFGPTITLSGLRALRSEAVVLYVLATLIPNVVLAYRLGYQSWTELMPSGPRRDVPGLRAWIMGCAGFLLFLAVGSWSTVSDPQVGVVLATVAAIALGASAIGSYGDD